MYDLAYAYIHTYIALYTYTLMCSSIYSCMHVLTHLYVRVRVCACVRDFEWANNHNTDNGNTKNSNSTSTSSNTNNNIDDDNNNANSTGSFFTAVLLWRHQKRWETSICPGLLAGLAALRRSIRGPWACGPTRPPRPTRRPGRLGKGRFGSRADCQVPQRRLEKGAEIRFLWAVGGVVHGVQSFKVESWRELLMQGSACWALGVPSDVFVGLHLDLIRTHCLPLSLRCTWGVLHGTDSELGG